MDKIRVIEKAANRVEKVINMSNNYPNPYHILGIEYNENEQAKKSYYKLALLLHPDKHNNIERFDTIFSFVEKSYHWIQNNNVSKKNYWETIWKSEPITVQPDQVQLQPVRPSKKNIDYKIGKWMDRCNHNCTDLMTFDDSCQQLSLKDFKEIPVA